MKPISFFKSFFLFSLLTFTLFSCTDDTSNVLDTEPTVTIESESDVTLAAGGVFIVKIKGTKGTNNMKSLTINEAGTKVVLDRLTFNTGGGANPTLLTGANASAFDFTISIKSHTDISTKKYDFVVADEDGLSTTKSVNVTTGTALSMLEGILLNQSGPTGQGGLDLDTGAGTGSANATAEIRDEGVVDPVNDGTWLQQISGVNGSELKYIIKGQNGVSENFSFASISIKEQIAALWNNGRAFDKKSADGLRNVSAKVAVGDIFIVKNGTKYYLLTVKSIKITPDIPNDPDRNKDSYTFDVKF
jgi:hypothetical protein